VTSAWLAATLLALGVGADGDGAAPLFVDGELGHQASVGGARPTLQVMRPYAQAGLRYAASGPWEGIEVELVARGWKDFEGEADVDLRRATLRVQGDPWTLTVGLQQVAWGETFGVFIADLVNPRDLSDPLLNEMAWQRRPVLAVNAQWLADALSLQLVAVPVPRDNLLPRSGAPGDFIPGGLPRLAPEPPRPGRDAEVGGRVGWLFDSGLDTAVFAYRHRNRNPVYRPERDASGLHLSPEVATVTSTGVTASWAAGPWVLRSDVVVHLDTPLQDTETLAVRRGHQLQAILGIDVSDEAFGAVGAQVHVERTAAGTPRWVSARYTRALLWDGLHVELFAFKGLGNTDLWAQTQLRVELPRDIDLRVRYDHVAAPGAGPRGTLSTLATRRRALTWISWRF
jgi:hypothetical protein